MQQESTNSLAQTTSASLDYLAEMHARYDLRPCDSLDYPLATWVLIGAGVLRPEEPYPEDLTPLKTEMKHADYIDMVLQVWSIKNGLRPPILPICLGDEVLAAIFDDEELAAIHCHNQRYNLLAMADRHLPRSFIN